MRKLCHSNPNQTEEINWKNNFNKIMIYFVNQSPSLKVKNVLQ